MFELQLSVIKELGLLGEIFGGTKFQARFTGPLAVFCAVLFCRILP